MFLLECVGISAPVHLCNPYLKEMLKTAEAERSVLQRALEQKMANSMAMEEENRRLRENQMDQKKIKQQRQILKKGQAEVQKGLQEVREEKVKLQVCMSICMYSM